MTHSQEREEQESRKAEEFTEEIAQEQATFDAKRTGRPLKLLVGLDVQSSNDDALNEAFAFATLFPGTKIEILWAAPTLLYPPSVLETTATENLPSPQQMLRDRVWDAVHRFGKQRLADAKTVIGLLISHGAPVRALEETAFLNENDMIIVAARDEPKGALESILTGSTTRKLVSSAPCPVLVTRPKVSEAVPKIEEPVPHARRRIGVPHRYTGVTRNQLAQENMPLVFPTH